MSDAPSSHFLQQRIEADVAAGRYGGRVATRFPPEPNGYLHIGHAKSIVLNFGLAQQFGGTCNLRFDDTNPTTEDSEYVDAILRDVRWLGFEPSRVCFASDYFEQLYAWAELLVTEGKAYVDDQSLDEIRANRGTVTEPGTPSPCRDRSPDDNLRLLRQMRAGAFKDGEKVLRARIDLAAPNMKLRDPLMYRIRHAAHHRTGTDWCIYPMYDWAHGQSDAIEGITHSFCTLEFEVNRPLYAWFLEQLPVESPPEQTEFARLNLTYTVMSKRKLRQLVEEGRVDGWDDPRMPTIAGMRRRGYTPEALRSFCELIGLAKANSVVDVALLEHAVRDDLNHRAKRRMGVLDPIKVELLNWPDGRLDLLDAPDYPPDVGLPGSRQVPLAGELLIDRGDFAAEPPKGWRRLAPGAAVRLRYGPVIRCVEVLREEGEIVGLRCEVEDASLGRPPSGERVRGTIHWVSARHAVPARVNVYDRLFSAPLPGAEGDPLTDLNPDSLTVVQAAWMEPSVRDDLPGVHYQLERQGYLYRAPEDAPGGLVFNQVVPLKDSWARQSVQPEAPTEAAEVVQGEASRTKEEAMEAGLSRDPAARAAYAQMVDAGAPAADAYAVAMDAERRALWSGGMDGAPGPELVRWLAHILPAEARGASLRSLSAAGVARLVARAADGLPLLAAREVLRHMISSGEDPEAIIQREGLDAGMSEAKLQDVIAEIVARHPDELARWRAGEQRLFGFFMGQVMAELRGKADAASIKAAVQAALKD